MSKIKNINMIKVAMVMAIVIALGFVNVSFASLLGDTQTPVPTQKIQLEETDNGLNKYTTPTPGIPTPGTPQTPGVMTPTPTPPATTPQTPESTIPEAGLDNTQYLVGAAVLIVLILLVANAISIRKDLI